MIIPLYIYDIEQNKPTQVLEIPLVLMDATLQAKQYMGLEHKSAIIKARGVIKEVKKFNGIFSILWHNNYFSEYKYTGWGEVFEQILEYYSGEWAVFMTGKEIADIFVNPFN